MKGFLACVTVMAGLAVFPACAADVAPLIGVVIMHGKGGSPGKHVPELASSLERQGYVVANIEMSWSGRRNYDVDVAAAEKEVESALETLRGKGAAKLFVAGHSQGGVFALHFGTGHRVDGIIAIAPGGNVASPVFKEKVGESLASAYRLIEQGKGDETARLYDYEGARGTYPVAVRPVVYVSWFDPNGAMNEMGAIKKLNPTVPVLFIAPTDDYPALQRTKRLMFDALPAHPMSRLYEPAASHTGAPLASIDEIVRWTTQVAGADVAR
ncbi:alpha/beta fold hydrolase [Herbaspirillum sp. HC18]|nr:alpha/beta fold hydrolase [Herbaspirillum sp. HC18]